MVLDHYQAPSYLMAVVRITATKPWMRKAARLLQPNAPRGAKELLRAVDRPGCMAELMGEEARELARVLPHDSRAAEALRLIEEGEAREAARPRGIDAFRREWEREK